MNKFVKFDTLGIVDVSSLSVESLIHDEVVFNNIRLTRKLIELETNRIDIDEFLVSLNDFRMNVFFENLYSQLSYFNVLTITTSSNSSFKFGTKLHFDDPLKALLLQTVMQVLNMSVNDTNEIEFNNSFCLNVGDVVINNILIYEDLITLN